MPLTPTVQLVSYRHAPKLLAHLMPPRGVMVIGGASGSGKSTLASALMELLPPTATLLQVECSYLGWRGLHAGVDMVATALLRASRLGYSDLTTWDWNASRPAGSIRLLAAHRRGPLVVEGVGADAALAHLANLVVRMEAPASLRAQRVENRDGYWSHLWDRWAADEEAHAHAGRLDRRLGGKGGRLTGGSSAPRGTVLQSSPLADVGQLADKATRRYFRVAANPLTVHGR